MDAGNKIAARKAPPEGIMGGGIPANRSLRPGEHKQDGLTLPPKACPGYGRPIEAFLSSFQGLPAKFALGSIRARHSGRARAPDR